MRMIGEDILDRRFMMFRDELFATLVLYLWKEYYGFDDVEDVLDLFTEQDDREWLFEEMDQMIGRPLRIEKTSSEVGVVGDKGKLYYTPTLFFSAVMGWLKRRDVRLYNELKEKVLEWARRHADLLAGIDVAEEISKVKKEGLGDVERIELVCDRLVKGTNLLELITDRAFALACDGLSVGVLLPGENKVKVFTVRKGTR